MQLGIMNILKRAFFDTFATRFGQLFGASAAGLVGWLYLYFWHGEDFALGELPFVIGAFVGTATFILVLFAWNLACAPYRIEKEARVTAEIEIDRLSKQVANSSGGYYSFSEKQLARVVANFRNAEILEPQIYVIFAPSSHESLDGAAELGDAIKRAEVNCEVHSGAMFPHDLKDRGITVYHGSDAAPTADASVIVKALEPLEINISKKTLDQSFAGPVIYVARPPAA
jgi:hypothetical protein